MAHAVLVFDGWFDGESFRSFCGKRAELLALDLQIVGDDARKVTVAVSGHPVLIDMFEMACGLGPAESIVKAVTRRPFVHLDAA